MAEILWGRNAHRYNRNTRERVITAAKEMGYRPSRHAQVLGGSKSRVIGVIKSVSYHQRNIDLMLHIGQSIHKRGYDVITGELFWTKEIDKAIDLISDLKAEGLILAHVYEGLAQQTAVQRIVGAGIPCITVGGEPSLGIPHYAADLAGAGREFVRHFKKAGYEKIFVIAKPEWEQPARRLTTSARMAYGFLTAALEEGYSREDIKIIESHLTVERKTPSPYLGAGVIELLLNQHRLDNAVVFFENDIFALSALQASHQRGIRVPEEVGIIGLDGSDNGAIACPPLTSLRLPLQKMAEAAVEDLFGAIAGKRAESEIVLFPYQPIIRESTRPI